MASVTKMIKIFVMSLFFALAIVFACDKEAMAIGYTNQSGEIIKSHEDTQVYKFSYGYSVKFDADSKYYNGKKIYDNGKSIEDFLIRAGKYITIDIKHVDKWWFGSEDDDKTTIYKYNFATQSFSEGYKVFVDADASVVLHEEGIYKIVYEFDGKIEHYDYIYITRELHDVYIYPNRAYIESSVYGAFNFKITMEDAYDLTQYKYYFAFGATDNNLNFREFNLFKSGEKNIKKVEGRDVSVSIAELQNLENQYFFLKIVKNEKITVNNKEVSIGYEKVVGSLTKFNLVSKVTAKIYITDKNGSLQNDSIFYKIGSTVYFKVVFNTDVTFSNLQYTVGSTTINISNQISEVRELQLSHIIKNEKDGTLQIKLKTINQSGLPIVKVEGVNVNLYIDENSSNYIKVDTKAPVISFGGDEITSSPNKSYNVEVTVEEENMDYEGFEYYYAVCSTIQDDKCMDKFDSDKERTIFAGDEKTKNIVIGNRGSYNGDKIVLFVKVTDKAGNVKIASKYGYILDNVIVEAKYIRDTFVESNIVDGNGAIIGKKLLVKTRQDQKINHVSYLGVETIPGQHAKEGKICELVEYTKEQKEQLYECLSVENYYYSHRVVILLKDEYGNIQRLDQGFIYNPLKEESIVVGEYTFNVHKQEIYSENPIPDMSVELSNKIGYDDERVTLDSSVLNEIVKTLGIYNVPEIKNLIAALVVKDGKDNIYLVQKIEEQLIIPGTKDILEKMKSEKYKNCAVKGNVCDLDLYLNYSYITRGVTQKRSVKITLIDTSNKYLIENFDPYIEVNVKEKFEGLNYKYVNNLNVEIKGDVSSTKTILFTGKDGVSKSVETIDTNELGKYEISEHYTYNGVESLPLNYIVVIADKIAPILSLEGNETIKLMLGESLEGHLSDLTASDNYDTSLKVEYQIDENFDNKKEGTYKVSYWSVDSSGNKSNVITRTIVVEAKNNLKTYLISGGIVAFVALVIIIAIIIEKKKYREIK